ncbi:NAD(P)/FAD-dependent oxidoreductase [Picosynechococcus sp. PCC 7117]|uniref:NAD(P)/FAD-dependent oxidoreductase n=1 Tax=Picosynechococcus sp. PCC 7117 TaxID=195498 RepID=UPI0008109A77|nr:NAD(P)/FAD-dependent oxidoreductase [Picosynechococcus sp. PCC 7117]ANV88093.1 flavoprotein [Picosynechococcus sp. PCC 7117]
MARLIVVGGGAAGFFGAIAAARTNPKLEVIILEAGKTFLSKVKISGGGRCNVTHHCFDPVELVKAYPRGQRELRGAFSQFQPQDMIAWLKAEGVNLKTEADGRMFPVTDDSETIIRAFLAAATRAKIQCRTGAVVQSIIQDETGQFQVNLKGGDRLFADFILLATGSHPSGHRLATTLGHKIIPPQPSLFTFQINDPRLQGLAGVSVPGATVSIKLDKKKKLEQMGPLLITHWGLSGPAVLKLSAWGARTLAEHRYTMLLTVNWLPDINPETLRQDIQTFKTQHPKKKITTLAPVDIPKRLWQSLTQAAGISPDQNWADLSKKQLNVLCQELTQGQYNIQGKGVFKDEFVTCGGVSLKEVNFKTLESRRCPGLFFAGEVLDIDGITGGFNFQSAWTTSWLAGQAIAQNIH